jgi:hypothetical protein
MIFEIQAEIIGDNLSIEDDLEFKKHPFTIRVFRKEERCFISFQKNS